MHQVLESKHLGVTWMSPLIVSQWSWWHFWRRHIPWYFSNRSALLLLDGGGPSVLLTDRSHRRTDREAREMICCLHGCFMVWVCPAVRIFSARAMGDSGKVNPLGLCISSTEAELKYTFSTNPTSLVEIRVVVRIYRQQNLEGSSLLSSCRMEHYFDNNLSL